MAAAAAAWPGAHKACPRASGPTANSERCAGGVFSPPAPFARPHAPAQRRAIPHCGGTLSQHLPTCVPEPHLPRLLVAAQNFLGEMIRLEMKNHLPRQSQAPGVWLCHCPCSIRDTIPATCSTASWESPSQPSWHPCSLPGPLASTPCWCFHFLLGSSTCPFLAIRREFSVLYLQ